MIKIALTWYYQDKEKRVHYDTPQPEPNLKGAIPSVLVVHFTS